MAIVGTESPEIVPDGLYFIQEEGAGPIKIGRTRALTSRLVRFQTGNSRKLTVLHFETGAGWQEVFWQVLFSEYHIRGEWFEPRPPLKRAALCSKRTNVRAKV